MNKFRMLTFVAASTVAITAFASSPAESAMAGSRHHAHSSSQRLADGSQTASDPEFSPLQDLASDIDQLATSTYPSTYAGVEVSAGELDVYVVPGDDQALLDAIAAANVAGLPYTIKYATRSYATQAATSQWLADNRALLQGEGINPGWWGAYPEADAVRVALQTPTSADLAELQSAAAQVLSPSTTVTSATYLTVASAVMNAQVPSSDLIVVYPTLLGTGEAADGYSDTSPFYGADQIEYTLSNTETCTSNFSFNGQNNPNNHWDFTAAHCSSNVTGHDFYTCATHNSSGNCNYKVGTVSTVYSNGEDFESIGVSSNDGYVWNDSTGSLWSVNGFIEAQMGDELTVDGQTNGAHYDNYVESGGSTTCVNYGIFVCHAIVISTGTKNLCIAGDSGGPVLERESDGYHIKAAGMILGFDETSGGEYFCYAQQVYYIRSQANVLVIWGN